MTLLARPVHAGQVGDLAAPVLIPAGQYVIIEPPTGSQNGKPVVLVSAPPEQWTPYMTDGKALGASTSMDCITVLSQARSFASQERLEALETSILNKKSPNKKLTDDLSVKADIRAVRLDHARCEQSDGHSSRFLVRPTIQDDINAPYER